MNYLLRISIITPSTNQSKLLELTICSVLEQEYSPLEYLIIDRGMNDEVRTLVESYAGRVTIVPATTDLSWQQAVNEGGGHADGSLLGWLLPGDCYLPGALSAVAACAEANPATGAIVGAGELCDETGSVVSRRSPGEVTAGSLYHWPDEPFARGACFVSMEAWRRCGPLRDEDGDGAELDLWFRIARELPFCSVQEMLVRAQMIPSSARHRMLAQCAQVIQRHGGEAEARSYLDRLVTTFAERQQYFEQLLAEQARELAEKSQRIEALHASVSWRVTAPVRAVDKWLKSVVRQRYEARRNVRPIRTLTIANEVWPDDLPLVSVIIPCFNYGEYVVAAIDSVLAQTFQDFEIIVVDGGSTDECTLRILRTLVRPKTTVFYRDERSLVGDNRNFGIVKASGKYICCLDADDLLKPTYLEKAVFLAECYHYDLVYPAVQCFGGDDHIWSAGSARFPEIARENAISTVALFRREAWAAAGGYRDWGTGDDHVPEDWEFWTRLLGRGYRAQRIPEPLMLYRVHGGGLTALNRQSQDRHRQVIAEANQELFTEENIRCVQEQEQIDYVVQYPFINLRRRCKNQPHILIAQSSLVKGGVDTVLLKIVPYLQQNGFTVSMFATVPPLIAEGESTALYEKITPEVYPLYKFLENRDHWKDFVDYLITSRETDIVYQVGCEYFYSLLPDIKRTHVGLKVVDQQYNEVWIEGYNRRYREYIDVTVAENEAIADLLTHRYKESSARLRLVPNGVDLDSVFVPGCLDADTVKGKYQIPPDARVIAFLGRFSAEKGPDLFVEILRRLNAEEEVYAVMGGHGPLFIEIENSIRQHGLEGKVLLPGFVDSRELLTIADVLVVPSRLDGRPNVILEGLAMGVPVVAAAVGGIPHLVRDGETGYLCEPGLAAPFVDKISLLCADEKLRQKMAGNARRYAEKKLDIRQMLESYRRLFYELVAVSRQGEF